ncbi:PAS domain-containing protein [Halobacillus salinarum]|uniref:PAS domain-containing protein n=1 Tax=Halobacillus salinarum TaxID=2932257 RepID=UPI0037BF9892
MERPVCNWLIRHIRDALIITDEHGEVLQINPPAVQFLGLKEGDRLDLLLEIKDGSKRLFQCYFL